LASSAPSLSILPDDSGNSIAEEVDARVDSGTAQLAPVAIAKIESASRREGKVGFNFPGPLCGEFITLANT
jgi:hypothetical protein